MGRREKGRREKTDKKKDKKEDKKDEKPKESFRPAPVDRRPSMSPQGRKSVKPGHLPPVQPSPPPANQIECGLPTQQVERLLQLQALPLLQLPSGFRLAPPAFPFPIPAELMPYMMKHFAPPEARNNAPLARQQSMKREPSFKHPNPQNPQGMMRQQSFGRMPPQQMPQGNQPGMARQQSFSGPPQGQMPGNNQPNMMRQQSFGRMSPQQMTQGNQPGIMRQQSFGRMPPQQMQMPPGNQPNMMRQQSFSGPPQGQMPGNNQLNMGRMSPQQMQQGNQPGIMRQQSFGRMSPQQMPQGNPVASPKGEPADTALPPLVRSTSILNRQSSFKKPKKKNSAINEPKLSQSADAGRNAGPSSHEAPLAAAPGLPRGEQTDFRQNSVSADDEARRLQEREREIMMMKQQQNMRENFQEERIAMERQREAQQRNATGVNRFLMAEENVRNNEKGEAKHRAAPQNGSPAPMTTEAPAPSEAPASRESPAPRVTPTTTVTTSTSGAATPQPAPTQPPVAEEKKSDPRMRFTAKLAVFEKPLQLGKRKKEPEDTSSHRVKTYGDDYCDIRVTMDDESIESFHVDELVAHRKGSSFVESKQLDGVVKMFTRGRNTCCFGFDEESHVSAQPLETPSWLVAQHVFASIAKCSDVSLDKNAEFVELYISFAAIKRKPDTPEEKTFEVLDLLAEGSVEFTGYRQVSHPLYGERLGGVTYRRVKSYQDFCKALLFAQSAAGTLRDTLEMKKQASSGDPLLAKECGSVIYVGSLIRKVVKGDIVVQGGVPAPDEVIDLSDSEVLGELQQNEDPGKLKLSSLEKCVNSLTFIGLQNQYDYIKPDCTLPLLQSLMSGPYYSVSIASVEPTSSGSVVPLNGMNSVCREHEKPLSGSVVRQLKSVRKEMQTLQAKIDSVRNGSAEQRELKVLLKKLQSKLSPLEESAQEPLQRLFSMVATE